MMWRNIEVDPRRILVTRLRFLGDVILTLPAVAALRDAYPGAASCHRVFPGRA